MLTKISLEAGALVVMFEAREGRILRDEVENRIRMLVTTIAEHPDDQEPVETLRDLYWVSTQLPLNPRSRFEVRGPVALMHKVVQDAAREAAHRALVDTDGDTVDLDELDALIAALHTLRETLT